MARPRLLPDNFVLALAGTVVVASLLPCAGGFAQGVDAATKIAVALLFFLHGARLSGAAVRAGLAHWRLHALALATTFLLFPLLGVLLGPLLQSLVGPDLYRGILFLCVLPSTVQSSIALTALARGNVPAAVCGASASNLVGIVATPLLAGALLALDASAGPAPDAVGKIVLQLLLPFAAGHLARRWIGAAVARHKAVLKHVDQGAILLVVYGAFSEAVVQGLWRQVAPRALAGLVLADLLLLLLVLALSAWLARRCGLRREDEAVLVFCGSKKSLASGVPIARVLFDGHALGTMVLTLMLFHQMQLMLCAVVAGRYARAAAADTHPSIERNDP